MTAKCKHHRWSHECRECDAEWKSPMTPHQTPPSGTDEIGCKCQGCGSMYRVDITVPDELWNRIRPEGKPEGAGLLCGHCIVSRVEAIGEFSALTAALAVQGGRGVPEGWRLIKNSTQAERSFSDDGESYRSLCSGCHRSFTGHKSRVKCRVCEVYPPVLNPADVERSRAEAKALIETILGATSPEIINPYGSGPEPIGPREDVA